MKYDFIAIGDTVVDVFIRLFSQYGGIKDGDHSLLCLPYPEKIPFQESYTVPAVGNSANAAVAASRLGLASALITNVGDDRAASEIIEKLESEHVSTSYVFRNKGKSSNQHFVLWYGDDRTILIKHEDYPYHLPAVEDPGWIYFSSIGEHALSFHDDVAEYMASRPHVKFVFQPGTFQIKVGRERLKEIYRRTELFFSNREEAMEILKAKTDNIRELAKGIRELGPRIVVITDGIRGAYALDGNTIWYMRDYPDPKPPFERTGAGDAFSSTFTAALALGRPLKEALMWGPVNSMSVVQYVGAQEGLLRRSQLEKFLAEAPSDYKPTLFAKI